MRPRAIGLHALWLTRHLPAWRAFRRALGDPARAQAEQLSVILSANRDTDYGRRYHFACLRSAREYQDAVPVVTAAALEPWIAAVADGRKRVLTADPVVAVERTGGSTGGAKHVPYTAGLLAEFRHAVGAWMVDLFTHRPGLAGGGQYWAVSPLGRRREVTSGGVPIGLAGDADYFGPGEQRLLRRLLVIPPALGLIEDVETSRYATLRFLLGASHLSFVSVWNPTFLTLLLDRLDAWADRLLGDLQRGTLTPPAPLPTAVAATLAAWLQPDLRGVRRLRATLGGDRAQRPARLWPRLGLISCWASASAARSLPALRRAFPGVPIQGKGLIATEGIVTIPLVGHPGAAPALTSHFLEFADPEQPGTQPRLVQDLEPGRVYRVLLTTSGGLYRYDLGDEVVVVGRIRETPLLEFVGRGTAVSDLCGEKLHEGHVVRVLAAAEAALGVRTEFLMLAPEWDRPPYYALFVEADLPHERLRHLANQVERGLLTSPTYAYCRALGQLGPTRAVPLLGRASAAYVERCAGLGQRVGTIKPVALHPSPGWQAHLPAASA